MTETKDAINPDHYKAGFSNGAQVIDIAENLNGNGFNIVKYGARSTRLDESLNKGKPIEDLNRVLWYAAREIGRRGGEVDFPGINEAFRSANVAAPSPAAPAEPEGPRIWENPLDIPVGTTCKDRTGDTWRVSEDGFQISHRPAALDEAARGWVDMPLSAAEHWAPYTEVLVS